MHFSKVEREFINKQININIFINYLAILKTIFRNKLFKKKLLDLKL